MFSKDPGTGNGESADDFWVKENGTWMLNRASSGSLPTDTKNNFRAKVFAYDRESTILNYTPDPGFTGVNIVKYTVSDGKGGSASAQVEFFVGTEVVIDSGDSGDGNNTGGGDQGGGITKDALTGNELYGRISGKSKVVGSGGKAVNGWFEIYDELSLIHI